MSRIELANLTIFAGRSDGGYVKTIKNLLNGTKNRVFTGRVVSTSRKSQKSFTAAFAA